MRITSEFSKLIEHLRERLAGTEDNKPRVFRDSAMDNLKDFFNRFKTLSVRSNAQLEDLVASAQRLVAGVGPQDLRDSAPLRQQISSQLGAMQTALDALLVERPRRRILREPAQEAA